MSTKHDGGPAFPVAGIPFKYDETGNQVWELRDGGSEGMTLRDYFAAKALPMLILADATRGAKPVLADTYAEAAYSLADAMLKAREE
jgi:hypothetical protein